jgi:hypothetical protein
MKVELFYHGGCPNFARVRGIVRDCLTRLGLAVEVEEHDGDFPSPSLRVDGVDVMGEPDVQGRACRLDVPTQEKILVALKRAMEAQP